MHAADQSERGISQPSPSLVIVDISIGVSTLIAVLRSLAHEVHIAFITSAFDDDERELCEISEARQEWRGAIVDAGILSRKLARGQSALLLASYAVGRWCGDCSCIAVDPEEAQLLIQSSVDQGKRLYGNCHAQ